MIELLIIYSLFLYVFGFGFSFVLWGSGQYGKIETPIIFLLSPISIPFIFGVFCAGVMAP